MKVLAFVVAAILVSLAYFFTPREAFTFLFGWAIFLYRVIPDISVEWPTVAVGAGAFLLFAVGIHLVGRSCRKRLTTDRGAWKLRWSLGVVVMVIITFTAGVAMIGMVHQAVWMLTSDAPVFVETVRARSSTDNCRDVGFGVQNYHDVHDSLPPGGTFTAQGNMLHSWETHLLPYMVYSTQEIDMKCAWNDPRNARFFKCVLPEFINRDMRAFGVEDAEGYGLSHYAANSRVFFPNSSVKLHGDAGLPGGTILIGEVNARFKPWGHPVNWRDPALGINRTPSGFGGPPGARGATFLMADGSVRFVEEGVSPDVLRAMSFFQGSK